MKIANKLWIFLVALVMSVALVGVMDCRAADVKYKGKDGELKWTIDSDWHLEITGHGDYESRKGKAYGEYNLDKGWHKYKDQVKSATVNVDEIYTTEAMFAGFSKLKSVDLAKLDTSYVTDMSYMFSLTFLIGFSKLNQSFKVFSSSLCNTIIYPSSSCPASITEEIFTTLSSPLSGVLPKNSLGLSFSNEVAEPNSNFAGKLVAIRIVLPIGPRIYARFSPNSIRLFLHSLA